MFDLAINNSKLICTSKINGQSETAEIENWNWKIKIEADKLKQLMVKM